MKHKNTKTDKICLSCGKHFQRNAYRIKHRRCDFCSLLCSNKYRKTERNPAASNFPIGQTIDVLGYVVVKVGNRQIRQHRIVMESIIGRKLSSHEVVHHINGIRHDNSPDNLLLCSSNKEHMNAHKSKHLWSINYPHCIICGTNKLRHIAFGMCIICYHKNRTIIFTKAE